MKRKIFLRSAHLFLIHSKAHGVLPNIDYLFRHIAVVTCFKAISSSCLFIIISRCKHPYHCNGPLGLIASLRLTKSKNSVLCFSFEQYCHFYVKWWWPFLHFTSFSVACHFVSSMLNCHPFLSWAVMGQTGVGSVSVIHPPFRVFYKLY